MCVLDGSVLACPMCLPDLKAYAGAGQFSGWWGAAAGASYMHTCRAGHGRACAKAQSLKGVMYMDMVHHVVRRLEFMRVMRVIPSVHMWGPGAPAH